MSSFGGITPVTSSAGNASQASTNGPSPAFGTARDTGVFNGSSHATLSASVSSGSDTVQISDTTTGSPSQTTGDLNGSITLPKNASATPSGQVNSNQANADVTVYLDDYVCLACKNTTSTSSATVEFPSALFQCLSCSNMYHIQCPNESKFGSLPAPLAQYNNTDYYGLEICKNCHARFQDTVPAAISSTQLLTIPELYEISNPRQMPRRSKRDRQKISECEMPDPVAITAEHFGTGAASTFHNPASDLILNESDEPLVEALFELGDAVHLLDLSKPPPSDYPPFRVIARYFNDKAYSENDSDEENSLDVTKDKAWKPDSSREEIVADEIGDLLGKSGWYYKLDRCYVLNSAMVPDAVLWHEDKLELALDDDSCDDEDDEDEHVEDAVTIDDCEDRNGHERNLESGETKATVDTNEDISQSAHSMTPTPSASESGVSFRHLSTTPRPFNGFSQTALEGSRTFYGFGTQAHETPTLFSSFSSIPAPNTPSTFSFSRPASQQPNFFSGFKFSDGQPK